jgi:uncharacterized protein
MMYLVDTNVILEILLDQAKKKDCRTFLDSNVHQCCMSDFSLHSIGVILFKYNKEQVFKNLVADIMQQLEILTLPRDLYRDLADARANLKLDFDDAYQFCLAKSYRLTIATMDTDFKRAMGEIEVRFL